MSAQRRRDALRRLEEVRGSKVLVHFLSDRISSAPMVGIMASQLGGEAYPFVFKHLRAIGKTPRLDLFLHTSGGQVDSVWPFVQLCRSFATERFTVIVPLRALSSGTLLCLGADEILMTDAGQLSPVDPTTQNAFNPRSADGLLPISVEDVTSYFQLATDSGDSKPEEAPKAGFGLKSADHILEVFRVLATQVHPLALGNVKRVHTQIRSLAKQLLQIHLPEKDRDKRIKAIVQKLTQELFSHGHMINRQEAIGLLGDDFVKAPSSTDEEGAIWSLFEEYESYFKLTETFSVREWLGADAERVLDARRAITESTAGGFHVYRTNFRVRQTSELPSNVQVQIPAGQGMPLIPGLPSKISGEVISQGWTTLQEE